VNFPRFKTSKQPELLHVAGLNEDIASEAKDTPYTDRKPIAPRSKPDRLATRLERDRARGYSINIKQVVLAFLVEFVIIGLILVSQFVYAAQIPNASLYKIVSALLFPIALAMVELARVPLALAVRTQERWYIKTLAFIGVASAVVVTSVSLSTIGHLTFNPRLEDAHEKQSRLREYEDQRALLATEVGAAEDALTQKRRDRDSINERYNALVSQLNSQPNISCTAVGARNYDGTSITRQVCKTNPALKPLQDEISATKPKMNEAEVGVKQAQEKVDRARAGLGPIDEKIRIAKTQYGDGVYQSQLHAYTAMLFRKDPQQVTDGEVKTLQWYLIVIPSIAAALSSTLIAMTAVRRFRKTSTPEPVATLPDEAIAFLFGPLVAAIKAEANNAVMVAMEDKTKAKAGHNKPEPAGA
jgi:hypothetical protein